MSETVRLPLALRELFRDGEFSVTPVSLDQIDGGFRSVRFDENPERVELFARILQEDPEAFDPVVLVRGEPWLIVGDGRHRTFASASLGLNEIRAVVLPALPGTSAEQTARLIGARMTARASEPLTKAERKELARHLAADHPDWSQRQIGRETGLDHKTVARCFEEGGTTDEVETGDYDFPRAIDEAVRQLDRFIAKLREDAVFNNMTKFRQGTSRRLAQALVDRYGERASEVAGVVARYFTDAETALGE